MPTPEPTTQNNSGNSGGNSFLTGVVNGLGLGLGPGTVGNPLTGISAVGDFFQRLTQANTWIRVAEVLLGFLLLTTGLAKLTGATSLIGKAAKLA